MVYNIDQEVYNMYIRQAEKEDVSRIAEILVYNNRTNYFPIFQDEGYSFGEMQVLTVAENYLQDDEMRNNVFVYDDGIIRGFVQIEGKEIKKLYVDTFFQSKGIGAALIGYAVTVKGAEYLWALEKNRKAIRFYERHGFHPTGERIFEEGTTEYLLKLTRQEY